MSDRDNPLTDYFSSIYSVGNRIVGIDDVINFHSIFNIYTYLGSKQLGYNLENTWGLFERNPRSSKNKGEIKLKNRFIIDVHLETNCIKQGKVLNNSQDYIFQ